MAYFGTDGIRGSFGSAFVSPSFYFLLGVATARYWQAHHALSARLPRLCIGRDTRFSGAVLVQAFLRGFTHVFSITPMNLGICPTPVVAWFTATYEYDMGVVVTASHNPSSDNGIKFFLRRAFKATDEQEAVWSRYIDACVEDEDLLCLSRASVRFMWPDTPEAYYDAYARFCDQFYPLSVLRKERIVIDCAHGACTPWVQTYLASSSVCLCHASPNGHNINAMAGALHPLQAYPYLHDHQAAYAFALDGDADRLMVIDAQGQVWDGDYLILLFAHDQYQRGLLTGIVGTVMTNLAVARYVEHYFSLPLMRSPVGDKYVSIMMRDRRASLGAESSGHIISVEGSVSGDGILSLLLFLRVLREQPSFWPLVCRGLRRLPSRHVSVALPAIGAWSASDDFTALVSRCELLLEGQGRLLVRPSGTEPLLRILIEAEHESLVDACYDRIYQFFDGMAS